MPPLRDVGLTSAARSVMQRMACKRARRRRERDCDIIGHVTRPSLRAGGDRARSEGPGCAGWTIRRTVAASGETGAGRERSRWSPSQGAFQARRGEHRTGEARVAALARRARTVRKPSRSHREGRARPRRSALDGRADRDAAPRCARRRRAARRGVPLTDARDSTDCERRACRRGRSAARPHGVPGRGELPGPVTCATRRRSQPRRAAPAVC